MTKVIFQWVRFVGRKKNIMTDQQKKSVEKEIKTREKTEADSLMRSSFRLGAEEVLNNPEKYGLIEISKVLQGLGLKGDDTCKP